MINEPNINPAGLSKEAYERMEGKLFRKYVGERIYRNIKEMGDYYEETIQGVPVLLDHSWEPFKQFIIIRQPKFNNAGMPKNKFLLTDEIGQVMSKYSINVYAESDDPEIEKVLTKVLENEQQRVQTFFSQLVSEYNQPPSFLKNIRGPNEAAFEWTEPDFPTDPEEILQIIQSKIERSRFLTVEFGTVNTDEVDCQITNQDNQDQLIAIGHTKLEALLKAVTEWRAVMGYDPTKSYRKLSNDK